MTDLFPIHASVVAVFAAILGLALVSDIESLRIPNRYCAALVLLYPAHLFSAGTSVDWPGALLVAVAVFLAGLVPFSRCWMGGGDVKLMAAGALWLGLGSAWTFLAGTALAGGVLAVGMVTWLSVAGRGRTRPSLPYGVAIAAGGVLGTLAAL